MRSTTEVARATIRSRQLARAAGCAAILVIAAACEFQRGGAQGAEITVVDSALVPIWDTPGDSGTVYTVEVVSGGRTQRVRDVVVPLPTVVADTLVVGLIQVSEDSVPEERRIFRLNLGNGVMQTLRVPADAWAFFHDIVVSPDGRYIAYVAADSSEDSQDTFAVVRELESGRIVARGPAGAGCDCETDSNHARWIAPDSFEIAVEQVDPRREWQRISGRVGGRIRVDTLRIEPQWH